MYSYVEICTVPVPYRYSHLIITVVPICKLSMPVPTCLSWPCKKAKSTGTGIH